MEKQLLFCVETNPQSGTDYKYIKKTVESFCKYDRFRVSLKPVYMGTKTAYDSKKVGKKIKDLQTGFSGDKIVVYCIDMDNYDRDPADKKTLEDIKNYCEKNNYEFVWFYRDIEDVYLGKQIDNTKKTAEAAAFERNNEIKKIEKSFLSSPNYRRHYSNILLVLQKYFELKNE